MSFPYMNEDSVSVTLVDLGGTATPQLGLLPQAFPAFEMARPMDVSGMELAIAVGHDASTGVTKSIASGTTTVVFKPYDGGTSATNATGTNNLFAVTDFSNSITGGWTVHQARKAVGTSTTDLDADDWVNLDVAANLSGTGGFGEVVMSAYFIYGTPGAPG